jgi:hypothetical protein
LRWILNPSREPDFSEILKNADRLAIFCGSRRLGRRMRSPVPSSRHLYFPHIFENLNMSLLVMFVADNRDHRMIPGFLEAAKTPAAGSRRATADHIMRFYFINPIYYLFIFDITNRTVFII